MMSNPAHDEVYSIHHYVIKFVWRQVDDFPRVLLFLMIEKMQFYRNTTRKALTDAYSPKRNIDMCIRK